MLGLSLKTAPRPVAWSRADANPQDLQEYDAFGPWLIEIHAAEDMPRRFRPAYERLKHAAFLIKIPHEIERRDARPGTPLYRQVFAADETGFTLLTEDDSEAGFSERGVFWSDVVAVQRHCHLLYANFALLLRDGESVEFDFSAVSLSLIDRVAVFARLAFIGAKDGAEAVPATTIPDKELFFQSMLAETQRESATAIPVHFEAPGKRCRNDRNRRRITTGRMFLVDGRELVVIDRVDPMRRLLHPNYARRRTSLDLGSVEAFHHALPVREGGFGSLDLQIAGHPFAIPCLDTPETLIGVLKRRGIAEI